jgi:hypothetical protein
MTLILKITDEGSQYSDQLHDLLGEFGLDPAVDDELDDLSLLPAYVLAGASIRTEAHSHGTHMHVIARSPRNLRRRSTTHSVRCWKPATKMTKTTTKRLPAN